MPTFQEMIDNRMGPAVVHAPLCPGHLMDVREFPKAGQQLVLSPTAANGPSAFPEPVLYLFYGSIYYRPRPERFASSFPIAVIFSPNALTDIARYFPFDTGAMHQGLFQPWENRLDPWRQFEIASLGSGLPPVKLVDCLFGGNAGYLDTRNPAKNRHSLEAPVPDLVEFLNAELPGVDDRKRRIECQALVPLALEKAIWIGYPTTSTLEFAHLYERIEGEKPERFTYSPYEPRAVPRTLGLAPKPVEECAMELAAGALAFCRARFPEAYF